MLFFFFFSSRRRHTRFDCDWSSDVCSSDLVDPVLDSPNAYPNGSWDLHEEYASQLYPDSDMVVVSIANAGLPALEDRKSTRLNSSHSQISYAVFCLKKKKR